MDREEAALKFLLDLLLNRGVFHTSESGPDAAWIGGDIHHYPSVQLLLDTGCRPGGLGRPRGC
jgi:hypothetical protein